MSATKQSMMINSGFKNLLSAGYMPSKEIDAKLSTIRDDHLVVIVLA